ncbi:response regulator transcription factor [Lysinibacillus sp. 3P01SB]|uniref:response regulator transcription factor n=1 Tax=Lysinibacillus sp. 3P01SB TaxID=3132284 RepID=UPI0039A442E3
MQNKILIIEDDLSICELLELFLTSHGFTPFFAQNGYEGLLLFEKENPNLVLLDIMIPGIDGIQTCKEIRKISNVPIIFISCKKGSFDIIEGLEAGGDDYITKPFIMEELLARIRSNLRRAPIYHQAILQAAFTPFTTPVLTFDELKIEENTQKVFIENEEIPLSSKEYRLLLFLAQHPNKIWSSSELYSGVWGNDSMGDTRTVNVHISNIRKKIEKDVSNPQYILTIRGGGFMFNGHGEA